MRQFARIRTKDSIVPVILKGEQLLDLRRVVSDITADGGVALELSQNSGVTRTLRAPSSEQLIGPANGTLGTGRRRVSSSGPFSDRRSHQVAAGGWDRCDHRRLNFSNWLAEAAVRDQI